MSPLHDAAQSWPECVWLGPHLITTVSALSLGLEYLAQPLTSAGRAVSPLCSQPLDCHCHHPWAWVSPTVPGQVSLLLHQGSYGCQSSQPAPPWQNLHVTQEGDEVAGAAPARTPQISIVRAWSSAVSQTETLLRWPFAFDWFPEHWFFWLSGFIFILGGTGLTDNLTHLWLESPFPEGF